MNTLDITKQKETGQALYDFVCNTVNSKDTFLFGTIPDTLKMTATQYTSLLNQGALEEMQFMSELTGQIKPLEEAKIFRTKQETNVFGQQTGGYALEVEVVPDELIHT